MLVMLLFIHNSYTVFTYRKIDFTNIICIRDSKILFMLSFSLFYAFTLQRQNYWKKTVKFLRLIFSLGTSSETSGVITMTVYGNRI